MKKLFLLSFCIIFAVSLVTASTVLAKGGPPKKLSHGSPQSVGMDEERIDSIDELVKEAITDGITPGAVVLIAKDNKIIKEDAYGYASKYDMGKLLYNPKKMTIKTVFDLASVTKVMATTQGIMKLVSDGDISVEDKVVDYIPGFGNHGKGDITIEHLLTHTSGLTPWQPAYLHATNSSEVLEYINDMELEYETGTDRRYSDFSFMMLGFVIEEVSGQRLDDYLEENIYDPLKMKDTMFNASDKINKRIASTSWGNGYEYKMIDDPNFGYYVEEDADDFEGWRDYTLNGEVNDGNSYYANNGIAGHAGLFSNARDLAVLGQAMLNNGQYGNISLYDEETVQTFTDIQHSGQGFGWERNQSWYMGNAHSGEAYGHTGFTGTQVIFDPVYNLQIIVLTNKLNVGPLESGSYPGTGNLSSDIAETVYEAMNK
ncbi:serine hydrolase [Virgibacillus sp. YIM 98842]|uniref:serine hydrolase n=1 Tax=Virgibacillus sp. YIM 98842 TaxID=2663533 RepID=UPI0013D92CB5|nr:serine hydrolase [Virgibacillus sp. YIM 98842]